jgi:NTE family protein
VDRKNDLTYHDRTLFDERMALIITDYVNIANSLIQLTEDDNIKKSLVNNILERQAETRNFSTGKHLKYVDLIEHMVSVEQVIRIERKNDTHTISNKTFDFSKTTVRNLIRDGYRETLEQETNILQVWDSEHPR